ncbi:putative nad dependent epimerase protein [Drechmeria coniospora]|uniref:Putative nad dependent epimerase protein n=1 Tax=Drechmeria coniospora TaxID=98403 RepID=A0A151GNQ5_DRECN|nr:putative nad dependent epimerase protein [Drechmeria coniospora]KYK58671.1 putative nad dependent epimerase protein [Drechmeria coniospora]ODA84036.1 hypothetical protein RJ55_02554 [Drechmeria coniospora]
MTTRRPRLFMTGAAGYVGSVLTELALAEGYDVHGLSRSATSDEKLLRLGAVPVRGDLTSVEVLRRESAEADVVIGLATACAVAQGSGGDEIMAIDEGALDALGDALAGTDKPLVLTSGTLAVAADPSGAETTETSPMDPNPDNLRTRYEAYARSLADRGVRVAIVRLAPYVYGRAGSRIELFMTLSAQAGRVPCVDGGRNHTSIVHVDDAARLYLLAAQRASAGEVFNASAATDVTARQIFEAIAAAVSVPLQEVALADAKTELGEVFAYFLSADHRASGEKATRVLGWQPRGMGILHEINKGSYQTLARTLRSNDVSGET